jgi:hypothetical protein
MKGKISLKPVDIFEAANVFMLLNIEIFHVAALSEPEFAEF